ncbi:RNase adapter RapZ [Sinanaerobacter sp. ZZT-01]|uniref:RNase adapter RapZ n=1 Tax=Sinanaerobacter sp. ZZT-01 TaxID=3111540 RepID=UPI002D7A2576|nr:RNase adapter RapZ [Sinanaerobacter sp. ZZT-01]WRR94289.1 RNase adapter RapZ [Sinanaerobacter sp. ZZT-01]
MEAIIVTGLSGAGKSQAVHCMEDLGYYCIDNMPPVLIKEFINLAVQDKMKIDKAAFVVDIRSREFFENFRNILTDLKSQDVPLKVMFLEASDEVLIRRYKETRRSHPLSPSGTIAEGIRKERMHLEEIRKEADFILDTSNMKTAKLSEEIKELLLSEDEADGFTITIMSFGYKHGIPLDADWVFDMRFLPNPFYLASMKNLTGNSKKVQDYVLKFPESHKFIKEIYQVINDLIPLYKKEGKSNLVLAFGCTGGQHRSVTMANEFSRLFTADEKRVILIHRNL